MTALDKVSLLAARASGPFTTTLVLFSLDYIASGEDARFFLSLVLIVPLLLPFFRCGVSIACFAVDAEHLLELSKRFHSQAILFISILLPIISIVVGANYITLGIAISSTYSFLFNYSQCRVAEGAWRYYWLQGNALQLTFLVFISMSMFLVDLDLAALIVIISCSIFNTILIALKAQRTQGFADVISERKVYECWMVDFSNSFHTPLAMYILALHFIGVTSAEVAFSKMVLFIEVIAVGAYLPKLKNASLGKEKHDGQGVVRRSRIFQMIEKDKFWVYFTCGCAVAVSILTQWQLSIFDSLLLSFSVVAIYCVVILKMGFWYLGFFLENKQSQFLIGCLSSQFVIMVALFLAPTTSYYFEYTLIYLIVFHTVAAALYTKIEKMGYRVES